MMTQFGKVAVLMGGRSAEREISLRSGEAVLAAMLQQGIDAHKIDVDHSVAQQLLDGQFDRAFIALHGRGGEDGAIQGLLDTLNMPYTGSGVMGAALSINKAVSKDIWQQHNVATANFSHVNADTEIDNIIDKLGLPLFIKPVNEGSSIGMSRVDNASELKDAIQLALNYDNEVIAECWIDGGEYTVAVLDGQALPVIQLKTPNAFYDFDAKYQANTTQYLCPSELSEQDEAACQALAVTAFQTLHMQGWGRVDVMRDKQGQFYVLEANSVPGMTDHSLVPMAANHQGISFEQLVVRILETSLNREDV